MTSSPVTFLFKNGVILPVSDTPPIFTFLATHSVYFAVTGGNITAGGETPSASFSGAYTTTRTHNNGETLLFYDRHLNRLSNSLRFLLNSNPRFIFGPKFSSSFVIRPTVDLDSIIRGRMSAVMRDAIQVASAERSFGEELAVSALIGGNAEEMKGGIDDEVIDRVFDVYLHVGMYVPPVFGVVGAKLAVVGNRRSFAEAKYSDWARKLEYLGRLRKPLEKLRPPSVTELLLSDDDGRILEGTITNFFVVCSKGNRDTQDDNSLNSFELQTAPVTAGVLPGVIRQLILEICLSKGITVREVSPSWLERGTWVEAFITNSLRLVQHVESIQAPSSRSSMESKSWEEVTWVEKQFKAGPGFITALIQREIMKKAGDEGQSLAL